MKKNLFEMGASFGESWSSDNKTEVTSEIHIEALPPHKHKLHFAKEKRRGKVVTIVKPFALEKESMAKLLKKLKSTLGTGGTLKEDTMEFQGDIEEKLKNALVAEGFGLKKSTKSL